MCDDDTSIGKIVYWRQGDRIVITSKLDVRKAVGLKLVYRWPEEFEGGEWINKVWVSREGVWLTRHFLPRPPDTWDEFEIYLYAFPQGGTSGEVIQ